MKPTLEYRPGKGLVTNAPSPSKRDVSTKGKPSSVAGPQAKATHVGTEREKPAVPEGRSSEGGGKVRTRKAPAECPATTAVTKYKDEDPVAELARRREQKAAQMRRFRANRAKVKK